MTPTVRLPDELRQAVVQSPDMMLRLYDDHNDVAYVLLPETVFERLTADDVENPLVQMQYAHVAKILGPDGLGLDEDETVV